MEFQPLGLLFQSPPLFAPSRPKEKGIRWTPEEDAFLKSLVEPSCLQSWNVIAEGINKQFPSQHRDGKQCRERWINHLSPDVSHLPWSEKEDAILLLSHKKEKNNWAIIAESLPGRSNDMVKNRFYTIFRKVMHKVKNSDYSYQSSVELLEILYVLECYEHCLVTPAPISKKNANRKKGFDFLYNLVKKIEPCKVKAYKNNLKTGENASSLFAVLQRSLPYDQEAKAIAARGTEKQQCQVFKVTKTQVGIPKNSTEIPRHLLSLQLPGGLLIQQSQLNREERVVFSEEEKALLKELFFPARKTEFKDEKTSSKWSNYTKNQVNYAKPASSWLETATLVSPSELQGETKVKN